MSFEFEVRTSQDLTMQEVLADLPVGDVATRAPLLDGPWPADAHVLGHLPRISARPIELHRNGDGYRVRIMSCSNRADHELALTVVERMARLTDGIIVPEGGDPVDVDGLRAWGDDHIEQMVESGPNVAIAMVREDGSRLTMGGAVRPYIFGPRTLTRLEAEGDPEQLWARVLADIVRVQNLELDHLFQASAMQVTSKDGSDAFTVAVVPVDGGVLPAVARYAFRDDSALHLVPAERLATVLGDRAEFIDEAQAVVKAMAEKEWSAVMQRAGFNAATD